MPIQSQRARLLIAAALIVLPFLFFWPLWWPGESQRRVFLYGDFTEQQYLWRIFVARELHAGRWPLWDPFTFAGRPALPDTQLAVFYPLTLWQALIPPPLPLLAVELSNVFHLGLAGVFCFGLARRLTGRAEAGLVAALAFSLGGYLTAYPLLQSAILQSAIWLPLSLWISEAAIARRSWLGIAGSGVAIGVSLLGGHPQTTMYAAYVTALYLIFRIASLKLGWRFFALSLAVWALTALGASAVQWLPSVELARVSPRASVPYDQVSVGFQLFELVSLFRPNLVVWSSLYIGALPFALAVLGAALRGRRVDILFWIAIFGVALVFSLGGNTPAFPLIYAYVPGFKLFRAQEHAAFIVSFALAVLAGYGCAVVLERVRLPRWAFVLGVGLILFDLYRATAHLNLTAPPPGGYFAATSAVEFLARQPQPENWRVSSEGLMPGGANASLYFQWRDVTGNTPLYPADRDAFHDLLPEVRWWQLLNVRYVLTRRVIDFPGLTQVVDDPARDQRLYQLDLGGRAAWVAHRVEIVPDQESAFALAADMNLEPLETAILEIAPALSPEPAAEPERISVTRFESQRVVIEAALSSPGVLILSEPIYPGWNVYVNGQPATALRAYGLLRAVALPAGGWQVEWRFEPLTVYAGMAVTITTMAVFAGLSLRNFTRSSQLQITNSRQAS
jgi:hypothetical protein